MLQIIIISHKLNYTNSGFLRSYDIEERQFMNCILVENICYKKDLDILSVLIIR